MYTSMLRIGLLLLGAISNLVLTVPAPQGSSVTATSSSNYGLNSGELIVDGVREVAQGGGFQTINLQKGESSVEAGSGGSGGSFPQGFPSLTSPSGFPGGESTSRANNITSFKSK